MKTDEPRKWTTDPIRHLLFRCTLTGVSAVLVVMLGVRAFSAFNHNDFMYAVAPVLLGEHALYGEFGFVQAPGSIWLYRIVFEIVPAVNFYIYLRCLSLFLLFASVIFVYRTAAVLAGRPACYLVPIFLCLSPVVISVAEEIGNTSLAMFFLSAAIFVNFTKRRTTASHTLVGLLIGLAASAKLNFALYAVPFGILIAANQGLKRKDVFCYIMAGLAASAPIWIYMAKDAESFWFNNIDFHYLTNIWRGGEAAVGIFAANAMLLAFVWHSLPQSILSCTAILHSIRRHASPALKPVSLILVTSLIAALAPLNYALQYLAPSALLLALLAALIAPAIAKRFYSVERRYWGLVFGVAVIQGGLAGLPQTMQSFHTYRTDNVAPFIWKDVSQRVESVSNQYLKGSPCPRTALSLSAIPFIGTGFSIDPYSATGSFLPRITTQIRQRTPQFSRYVSLDRILQQENPTAFLVGYYPDSPVERAIGRYAEFTGYSAFQVGSIRKHGYFGPWRHLTLFVRSICLVGSIE